jgi:hypothetical protein
MPVPSRFPAPATAPTGAPAASRPCPLWLRLAVLVAVAAALLLPLKPFLFEAVLHRDREEAAAVAAEFLEAMQIGDERRVQALLPPDATPARLTLATPALYPLQLPFVRFQLGPFDVQRDFPDVPFTLQYSPEPRRGLSFSGIPTPKEVDRMSQLLRRASQQADGQTGVVRLQRIGEHWRVWGVMPPGKEAPNRAILPLAGGVRQVSAAEREFEELVAVGPGDLARRLQLAAGEAEKLQNKPAGEVIKALAQGLGLTEYPAVPGLARVLDRRVTFKHAGRSRLEALGEVSAQVGLSLDYRQGGLLFSAGRRSWPVAFAGPFVVQVEQVREFPGYPTGALHLRCLGVGLPAAALNELHADGNALRVVRVSGADGQELYGPADEPRSLHRRPPDNRAGPARATPYEETAVLPLRNLLRDLDVLHEIRGRVRLVLPVKVARLRFTPLTPGDAKEDQGLLMMLLQVETVQPAGAAPRSEASRVGLGMRVPSAIETPSGFGLALAFQVRGADGCVLRWQAYDQRKVPLLGGQTNARPTGDVRLEVPGNTATVVFKVVLERQEVAYDFRLQDVPLPRPPRQLQPLRYPGHATPVTVAFARFETARTLLPLGAARGPHKLAVVLRVQDHTEKDIDWLEMKFTYLDAAGHALSEATRLRSGIADLTFATGASPLVKAGFASEVTVQDPDVPENTARIAPKLTAVGFLDGTSWRP